MTLVIPLEEPLDIARLPGGPDRRGRFDTAVSGLISRSVEIHHDGNQYGVQLALTPFGARALYGMPAAEIADMVVTLDDVFGPRSRGLVDRLRIAPTWPDRFAILDDGLLRRLGASEHREVDRVRPEVAEAWRQLITTEGAAEVGALSRHVGWSRRHLSEQFRREFGLTPKLVARVLRFERARDLAVQAEAPSWADVAAAAGYADQAHLTREWRDFTGQTPAAWRENDTMSRFE